MSQMLNKVNRDLASGVGIRPELAYVRLRGIYARVARKLKVDISYVSRVARGERYSEDVERAIQKEVAELTRDENGAGSFGPNETASRLATSKPVHTLVKLNSPWLREEWLIQCMAHPKLSAAKLTRAERLG